jgi:isochorismate synthase
MQQGVRQSGRLGRPIVVSITEPIAPVDVIDLFERARPFVANRYFWSQPGGDLALVGLGVAHAIDAVEASRFRQAASAWRHLLSGAVVEGPRGLPGAGPLLLGGFAFDAQRPTTPLWEGYPHGRLILPKLLFTHDDDDMWLTTNVIVTPDTDPDVDAQTVEALQANVLAALRSNGHRLHGPNGYGQRAHISRQELHPAAEWQAEVARAVRVIQSNEFEKVVLARAVQLHSTQDFNSASALRVLAANYVGCYLFAIARDDGSHRELCFLGATPEQLVRLRGDEVHAMSLAGSIRRGETPEADAELGLALLASAKDRREHDVVTQTVAESLDEACVSLRIAETPKLLKLGNIQHLCTPITGRLSNGYTIFDLVERLHPTPAVGGRPREATLHFIREHEGLDRGWYAGPVGWVNAEGEGEFAVALRSALLRGDTATLFAGCGLVADSDPEREYAESELKFKPMLTALMSH